MLKMKLFNFRPFVIIALAIICAIIFAVFIVSDSVARIIIFIVGFFAAGVLFVFYLIKKKNILIFLTILLIFIALPFLSLSLKTAKYNENLKYENSECLILGKISDYYKITKNGYLQIILEDIEIAEGDAINNLSGRVAIYTNPDYFDLTKLEIGTYIFSKIKLDFNTISSKDRWQLFNLSKGIVASGFTSFYNITIYNQRDTSLSQDIKAKVFNFLKKSNMESSDIAFGMMFGDSSVVDTDVKEIFQGTGISHLLAVSGLHVSAIVFAICWILKKLKVSRKWQLVLLITMLSFYSYLCNFSISVLRASFMAIILNYSYIRGKSYDVLSTLALLAAVTLFIEPLELFNLSFVLSFLATLSIILLVGPIEKFVNKIFYSKFAAALSMVIGIQIGLTFVNIFYFNTIQPLSFVANLISIPIATFAFIMIIIATILSFVSPLFMPLCRAIGELLNLVTVYNGYIKSVSPIVSTVAISPVFILLAFLLFFLISDYCFLKKRAKLIVLGLICISYAGLFFI